MSKIVRAEKDFMGAVANLLMEWKGTQQHRGLLGSKIRTHFSKGFMTYENFVEQWTLSKWKKRIRRQKIK